MFFFKITKQVRFFVLGFTLLKVLLNFFRLHHGVLHTPSFGDGYHNFPYSNIKYTSGDGSKVNINDSDQIKVLSYSLYGNNPQYVNGIRFTVEANAVNFPGWQVWIYHDEKVPPNVLEELTFSNFTNIVKTINVPRDLPKWVSQSLNPMSWRFLVASDPSVHAYAIRDSDSLTSKREKAAVDEWLQSGKSFHVMRDHPMHSPKDFAAILGGMWGGLHSAVPHMDRLLREYYNASRTIEWGEDQDFLWANILQLTVNDSLQHDAYFCIESGAIAFPMDREEPHEYIGNFMNRMSKDGKLRNLGRDMKAVDRRMQTKDMVERYNRCRELRKEKESKNNITELFDTPFLGITNVSSSQMWAEFRKKRTQATSSNAGRIRIYKKITKSVQNDPSFSTLTKEEQTMAVVKEQVKRDHPGMKIVGITVNK